LRRLSRSLLLVLVGDVLELGVDDLLVLGSLPPRHSARAGAHPPLRPVRRACWALYIARRLHGRLGEIVGLGLIASASSP